MERGTRIGDYEILDELGRGGMGRVYRVRNVISERVEALKVLLPGILGNEDLSARFLREIKVLAALDHPHIAALRTALTHEGQVAMVMELVEGEPLSKRLARGPLSPADAVAITQQVLAALSYAHGLGVIHRDIKPANMMLTDAGVMKLTDFGIARSQTDQALTATGTTAGSLSYMSPEQVNGGVVDPRSDVYSTGISLYEMVTGRPPFRADSEFGIMAAHVSEPPRPPREVRPDLPEALNGIILRAIAKDPKDRFQSADEFRNALSSVDATPVAEAAGATVIRPGARAQSTRDHELPRAAVAEAGSSVRKVQPAVGREGSAARLVYLMAGAILVVAAVAAAGMYLRDDPAVDTAGAVTDAAAVVGSEQPASVADTEPEPATEPPDFDAARSPEPTPPSGLASPPVPDRAPQTVSQGTGRITSSRTESSPAPTPAPQPAPPVAQAAPAQPPPPQPAAPAPEPATEPAARALDVLEREHDQAVIRASVVNDSLAQMQQELARKGLGLRGDIAARQRSLNLNLSRAEDALVAEDVVRARRYADAAQDDLEVLEKFLGR